MTKFSLFSTVILTSALLAPTASADKVEYGSRMFYGFFMTNDSFTNGVYGEYGFARQTFDKIDSNELIYRMGDNQGIYAAAAIDGIYYAFPYHYTSSLEPPKALPAFTYNIYNNHIEELGDWELEEENFRVWDMTYDLKNDRLLAVGYSPATGGNIYEVDRKDGHLTKLRSTPGSLIAADAFGRVFTITNDGDLYQIDMKSDDRIIKLASFPYRYQMTHQTLEFDLTSNKLYWAANTLENPHSDGSHNGDNGASTWLLEITMPTSVTPDMDYREGDFKYNLVGELGSSSSFLGMYIPYATGGFLAPGQATDIKTVSSPDGKSCIISFKAPTTTFGGEELTSIDGYDIYRNGERIFTQRGIEAGGEASYEDKDIPASGEYRYDIICYSNINGEGPKSPAFAYVGNDRPDKVADIIISVDDTFRNVELSWKAPEVGAMGGTFDPSKTTYDITRLPDNVEVAKDLTDTNFKDKLNRLLRYSYKVTAKNEYGSSTAVSKEFVAGKPVDEFPIEEPFDNPTAMLLKWTPVDNNNDGTTWLFGSTLGHSIFGDYETCAEYILSPTSVTADIGKADEWLISPPIMFDDDDYAIELTIRTLTPEHFNVYVGDKNTVEGMTLVKSFNANRPVYADDGRCEFQKYSTMLPAELRNNIGCVAFQLDSDLPDELVSYMQLANICIDTAKALSVDKIAASDANVTITHNLVSINGEFRSAAIYNMAGMMVRKIVSAETSINDLPGGIYIVTIDGKSYKVAR